LIVGIIYAEVGSLPLNKITDRIGRCDGRVDAATGSTATASSGSSVCSAAFANRFAKLFKLRFMIPNAAIA